jgi:aminoglycoside phosphotransferase (APT) family kinase protein
VAVANKREPASLREPLLGWLSERLPEADDIALLAIASPKEGASSETWLIDLAIVEKGQRRVARWVVRVQATGYQVYQDPAVEKQFRVLQVLAESSDVPVPRVLWHEADSAVLGAPFFVMERVEGEVPAEAHHSAGVLADAAPKAREAMWLSAIEAMTRIHRTDAALLPFLVRPELGATGVDQELANWDEYRRWAATAPHPMIDRARRWLDDKLPANRVTALAWGDARPGNIVFRDNRCVALLDWETVSLGGPESDLGWWLFFESAVTEVAGVPRLDGIGGRDGTIAAWEHFMGRKADSFEWHEVFATFRFAMIYERAVALNEAAGDSQSRRGGDANPAIIRLGKLIG